jgi:flagellar hook-length control protein FliK
MQQGELRMVTVDRAAADPLQARVELQPVNTASVMQRLVEQRPAVQGSDTKRLQMEIAAPLDARVSTESSDRPIAAAARFDPSTSVMPKPLSTPAPGAPEVSSRQLDTAVQDQIMRVMSRQALTQGRLTLQLNPHELGSLDIEFSTEKGEVQVAIIARETSTRDLLEASVARLRQSLQDVGVNVGQLDIRQGDRHSNEQSARQSTHQSQASDSSGPASKTEDAVSLQRRDDGGIHIYV